MSLRTITKEELVVILEKHLKWLRNEDGGERADLSGSNLSWSNLSGSNLSWSNLSGSNLSGSNLSGSDLSGSNLIGSDLSWSNLSGSNLSGSNLSGSNLSGSNLSGSDLSWSNLSGSNLSGSNLSDATGAELVIARTRTIPLEGSIIGWKKCSNGVLVKVKVPDEAKRSNAFGRKCRAECVDVLQVINAEFGISQHDGKTRYEVGQRVACDKWCDDWMIECAGGIHFFITREEAEAYSL